MACIHKVFTVDVPAAFAWNAIKDVGAVHSRLARGFVTDTVLEPGARIITFANGMQVRELIVDINDRWRRLAYAAVGGRASHHNASLQVFELGPKQCQLVWITDMLPDALAEPIGKMVEIGAEAIKKTLEADAA